MNEILSKVQNKQISHKKAYRKIYHQKKKKAHFVKLKIKINQRPGLNFFLAILLILPIPMFIVRYFAKTADRKQKAENQSDLICYKQLVNTILFKGSYINIDVNKTKIKVKTI